MTIKGVDLFCGVGGLSHGLIRAGIDIVAGVDIDEECRFAYEVNNPSDFFLRDIADLNANEVRRWLDNENGNISLLAGCAPCQPFSSA